MLKIVHERFKHTKKGQKDTLLTDWVAGFSTAMEYNKEIEPLLSKTQVLILPCPFFILPLIVLTLLLLFFSGNAEPNHSAEALSENLG